MMFIIISKKRRTAYRLLQLMMISSIIIALLLIFIFGENRILICICVLIAFISGLSKDFVNRYYEVGTLKFLDDELEIIKLRHFKIKHNEIQEIEIVVQSYKGKKTYSNFRDFGLGEYGDHNYVKIKKINGEEHNLEILLQNVKEYEYLKEIKEMFK